VVAWRLMVWRPHAIVAAKEASVASLTSWSNLVLSKRMIDASTTILKRADLAVVRATRLSASEENFTYYTTGFDPVPHLTSGSRFVAANCK
jgi:hypothetical protein